MTCFDRENAITLYVSGELAEAVRSELEQHLLECRSCRQQLSVAESLEKLLWDQPMETVPAGFHYRVMSTIDHLSLERRSFETLALKTFARIRNFGWWAELLTISVVCIAVVFLSKILLPIAESAAPLSPGDGFFYTLSHSLGIRNGGPNITYLNPVVIFFSLLFGALSVFGPSRFLRVARLTSLVRFW